MGQELKKIEINTLLTIVNNSDSLVEVTKKLGFDPNVGNIKKNVERLIKTNNISIEHFSTVKRVREYTVRYNKEKLLGLVKKSKTLKEILLELNILPIESNYKTLKKYLRLYEIDYSNIKRGVERKNFVYADYSEDNLRKCVSDSKTLGEILNKLGLVNRGNNFKTLKKYLEKYDIDISHLTSNEVRLKKSHNFNKIPTEKILIENSEYVSTNTLKKRLYKEGVKERVCELCGQTEEWNGKHMSLIMDHINGIHTDNRIENLRIVCPNCNATLPTFAGKNVKRKEKIINKCTCGKEIKNNSKLCFDCQKMNKRKVIRPSLEELLIDVNEFGYSATGRKYGVSDNSIRKWIKSYQNGK